MQTSARNSLCPELRTLQTVVYSYVYSTLPTDKVWKDSIPGLVKQRFQRLQSLTVSQRNEVQCLMQDSKKNTGPHERETCHNT